MKKKNPQADSRSEEKSADSVENADVSNGTIIGNVDASNGIITGNTDTLNGIIAEICASNEIITKTTKNKQKNRKYKGIYHYIDLISNAAEAADTMSLIRIIDTVYNEVADPDFSQKATLEQVLAVTMEDLTEFDWHDYLSEEMYEDALESYMEQLTSMWRVWRMRMSPGRWKRNGNRNRKLQFCLRRLWKKPTPMWN